jgi:hypothetical protein
MWLRTVDIGAHQACCPFLQALFMTAIAPPTMSRVTVRTINKGVFIGDLATAGPNTYRPRFFVVQNEPAMNARDRVRRLIAARLRLGKVSIGNSAQYHYGNKHDGERHANRFNNRTLVAHDTLISTFQNDMNTYLVDNSLR